MDDQKDLPLPETNLPAGRQDLPKPEKDLPLPEKELISNLDNSKKKSSRSKSKWLFVLLLLGVLLIIFAIGGYFILGQSAKTESELTPTPEQIACTQEAMLCPDGVTYVSRHAPNCEFAQCPEIEPEEITITPTEDELEEPLPTTLEDPTNQ